MKEKIYIVLGIKMNTVGTPNEAVLMQTGAINGETDANNWRKLLSSQMPNVYFRMVEIPRSQVVFWQAPIENAIKDFAK